MSTTVTDALRALVERCTCMMSAMQGETCLTQVRQDLPICEVCAARAALREADARNDSDTYPCGHARQSDSWPKSCPICEQGAGDSPEAEIATGKDSAVAKMAAEAEQAEAREVPRAPLETLKDLLSSKTEESVFGHYHLGEVPLYRCRLCAARVKWDVATSAARASVRDAETSCESESDKVRRELLAQLHAAHEDIVALRAQVREGQPPTAEADDEVAPEAACRPGAAVGGAVSLCAVHPTCELVKERVRKAQAEIASLRAQLREVYKTDGSALMAVQRHWDPEWDMPKELEDDMRAINRELAQLRERPTREELDELRGILATTADRLNTALRELGCLEIIGDPYRSLAIRDGIIALYDKGARYRQSADQYKAAASDMADRYEAVCKKVSSMVERAEALEAMRCWEHPKVPGAIGKTCRHRSIEACLDAVLAKRSGEGSVTESASGTGDSGGHAEVMQGAARLGENDLLGNTRSGSSPDAEPSPTPSGPPPIPGLHDEWPVFANKWERRCRWFEAECERLKGLGQAAIDKVHAEHERECCELIDERDRANDALQQAHIALGGDGEWVAKPGSICVAGETGDLAIDVPAIAEELRTECERLRALIDEATDNLAARDAPAALGGGVDTEWMLGWIKRAEEPPQ